MGGHWAGMGCRQSGICSASGQGQQERGKNQHKMGEEGGAFRISQNFTSQEFCSSCFFLPFPNLFLILSLFSLHLHVGVEWPKGCAASWICC